VALLLCKLGWHKDQVLAYGYPKYRKTWLTVKKCARCGRILREWDDLFADERPSNMPIEKNMMNAVINGKTYLLGDGIDF
jgi:hypothetical protein